MTSLEIVSLHAGYGASTVLRGVELSIGEGESVALVGRNGTGKSTLLMSLFKETRIFSGEIRIGGTRIDDRPGYAAAKLGVAISPQGRRILPNLTVKENLLLGRATGRRGRWDLKAIYDLFPVLAERADSAGTMLSGGQQQMLAIGRALMANPGLLLLDEPSEGLSPVLVDDLVRALNEIRRAGAGVLIVEQHLSLVKRATDRFVILSKGEIVGAGPTREMDSRDNRALMAL
ncbi:MAG: ABC transporter ATP-binding protein [Pseudomonadota bacterium]|nr:ABC transporter ATP-binding protein [Pseudomonadota bacterium]